ncbi:MAG TPA: tetratricopeptide repeat protein [Polyangiaceae bacterium]|nr:tetratricopeptide repeat protein [Polyangiaceae bacterium]
MDQTGELDVARFNALRQALFSASSMELQRWAEDVLGERLPTSDGGGEEPVLASLLLRRCREQSALDALYDAIARERSALRHAATTGQRPAHHAVAKSLGPYVLDARLGQGNSSSLFKARRGEEAVRLRVRSTHAENRRSAWQRFVRVARASSKLAQLGLPTMTDAGTYDEVDVIAHRYYEGVTVAEQLGRVGPRGFDEVWPLLTQVLDALQALHDAGLAHGSLHDHNVLIWGSDKALLLDPGSHFLRARRPERDWPLHVLSSLAPEIMRGEDPSPQADLYAFGVLLYRLLSGEGPFAGVPRSDLFAAQLGRDPEPISFLCKTGSLVIGLDELAFELLDKDPRQRPQRAAHVRQRLLELSRSSLVERSEFAEQLLDDRTSMLLEEPTSLVAAAVLEASVDQGADSLRVAEAFMLAADQLGGAPGSEAHHARLNLRAASLYETAGQSDDAIRAYRAVLAREPRNETARSELERLLRDGAQHEELIDVLLEKLELESEPEQRARVLESVAQLLEGALKDGEQALLAYVQALAADPASEQAAAGIERLAGSDTARWTEVLESLEQNLVNREPGILLRMGKWYQQRLLRPEAALSCFQAALEGDPHHDQALLAAAELLDESLNQAELARELYGRVFAANPGHVQACRRLVRLRLLAGDHASAVDCLERHAAATGGGERRAALREAAQVVYEELADVERAIRLSESALAEAPGELETLRQLEALYRHASRPKALEENLQRQLALASSPRQNVEITVKLATFVEQELFDEQRAADLLEEALMLEPDNLAVRRNLLGLYQRLGQWQRLASTYEDLIEHAPSVDETIKARRELAELLSQKLARPAHALEQWHQVLEHAPGDEAALRAIATIATRLGDEAQAARAVEVLARRATLPLKRAELWLEAAQLFEAGGELRSAQRHFQEVLELEPRSPEAWGGLRRIALARGDTATAIKLVDRELACNTSGVARAKLYVELAHIHRGGDGEARRAEAAAGHALELDENCVEAHVVLADCARDSGHFAEARDHYARALNQAEALDAAELARLQASHAACLSELGYEVEALTAAEACIERSSDPAIVLNAVEIMNRQGRHARALELCSSLLAGPELGDEQRARALWCQGQAHARLGALALAIDSLESAAELAGDDTRALEALEQLQRQQQDWPALIDVLEVLAQRTRGERRWALLTEAGELSLQRLGDTARAARLYGIVLGEHPHDHRVLVDLLALYGNTERWNELLPVIEELAQTLPVAAQSVPYLLTAARILDEKLNQPKQALSYLERALALAPDDVNVLEHTQRLARAMGNLALTEEVYIKLIELSRAAGERRRTVKLMEECYQLVSAQGDASKTLALCERAHALDPTNKQFGERLARIYRGDPRRHLLRGVELERERLRQDPTRPEPYQALLALYSSTGHLDAAWCVSQALVLMNQGGLEPVALFRKHQLKAPPELSRRISAEDWHELVRRPDVDEGISEVFAIIEPAMRHARGSSAAKLGLKPQMRIDPDAHDGGVLAALRDLAPVFGVPLPELYLSKTQKRALCMVRSHEPCLVLGPSALAELPPFQVAFTAASHLLHFRRGYGLRHLLATARALKVTLLAALKLGAPNLKLPADVAESVEETIGVLREQLEPETRRHLNELVASLFDHDHSVDLNHWLHGVDLMSDRLGFIACNDLGTALQLVRGADDQSSSASRGERCRELVRYAVDPSYIILRSKLDLAIQEQEVRGRSGQSPAA